MVCGSVGSAALPEELARPPAGNFRFTQETVTVSVLPLPSVLR